MLESKILLNLRPCLGTLLSVCQWHRMQCQRHCGVTGRNREQVVIRSSISDVLSPFQDHRLYLHCSDLLEEHPQFPHVRLVPSKMTYLSSYWLCMTEEERLWWTWPTRHPQWSLLPTTMAHWTIYSQRTSLPIFLLKVNYKHLKIQKITNITNTSMVTYLRCTLTRSF